MKDPKMYDSPVRLLTFDWTKQTAIYDQPNGQSQLKDHVNARQGYVIELHKRLNIVRIWSTRFPKAKVTTITIGQNDSWTIEGDEEINGPAPEGPRAA